MVIWNVLHQSCIHTELEDVLVKNETQGTLQPCIYILNYIRSEQQVVSSQLTQQEGLADTFGKKTFITKGEWHVLSY